MCKIEISIATREEVKIIEDIAASIMKDIKRNEDDLNKIQGFECERFGTALTITKPYDCMLDGSDKRAAEEAFKCFQKYSEESPESHIKLTTRRGGSKIDFF